jgi:hypothetical protein
MKPLPSAVLRTLCRKPFEEPVIIPAQAEI